jgi:Putative peptidoglycan binding domain
MTSYKGKALRMLATISIASLSVVGFVANTAHAGTNWIGPRRHNNSAAVMCVQNAINGAFQYNDVVVDGRFGPATYQAVADFQSFLNDQEDQNLEIDGIVGPATGDWVVAYDGLYGENYYNYCRGLVPNNG